MHANKSSGPDLITGHMLLICDESIVFPLQSIFSNILRTASYPLLWKLANVTPVYKKSDKHYGELPTYFTPPFVRQII